jgi:hypothetical protein
MSYTLCVVWIALAVGCRSQAPVGPSEPRSGAMTGRASEIAAEAPKSLAWDAPPSTAGGIVEVVALRLSAAGYMLDLRYRVKDPDRAAAFFDKQAERYLIDEVTGARFGVPRSPKVGPLRQLPHSADPARICFTLFANPGRRIKTGDRLTLAVGDLRIPNLVVE